MSWGRTRFNGVHTLLVPKSCMLIGDMYFIGDAGAGEGYCSGKYYISVHLIPGGERAGLVVGLGTLVLEDLTGSNSPNHQWIWSKG